MYMSFPVGLFYFFNQPLLYEDKLIKLKREAYPPEDLEAKKLFHEYKLKYQKENDKKMLKRLEEKQSMF